MILFFIVGHAAFKAASNKVTKYEKVCSDNRHIFIPLMFDTFVFLAPDVVDLLQRVKKICITMLSLQKD
jgi:hypothetical protein